METIPKTREEAFAYAINWSVVDAAKLSETVGKWASKKVAELLGQEEASLVEFIVDMINKHAGAAALVTELEAVLVRCPLTLPKGAACHRIACVADGANPLLCRTRRRPTLCSSCGACSSMRSRK